MEKKNIDFKLFIKLFDELYAMLYNNEEMENEFGGLVELFDGLLENEAFLNEVVRPFGKQREDVISSDREAIAFMLAWYIITQGDAPEIS